jgi:hypothetical protein
MGAVLMTRSRTDALGVTSRSTKVRFLCHFTASKETSNIFIMAFFFWALHSLRDGQPTAASTLVRVSPSQYVFNKRQISLIVAVTQFIPVPFLKTLWG